MAKQIEAPWTDEQVVALNRYQQERKGHPFTGNRNPDGSECILIATNLGWVKQEGGPVIQTWAWDFMAINRRMKMSKPETILAIATVSEEELNKAPNFIQRITSLNCVQRLLYHSWKDIGFMYEGLTEQEKACITKEEHAQLLPWVLGAGK